MINKRVNIYDACLGRMCISLNKNLEKSSIVLSLKKIPYRFSCVSSFSWSYRSILIKVRYFFQILAGRRSSYGNQEEEISPQTSPPPPHHCVLCKKSLRELAVFKRFAVLFPPFRVKILLNQFIYKVSKIFHCIFINTENGAIFVPVSG